MFWAFGSPCFRRGEKCLGLKVNVLNKNENILLYLLALGCPGVFSLENGVTVGIKNIPLIFH